jgi:hypothetical protein
VGEFEVAAVAWKWLMIGIDFGFDSERESSHAQTSRSNWLEH